MNTNRGHMASFYFATFIATIESSNCQKKGERIIWRKIINQNNFFLLFKDSKVFKYFETLKKMPQMHASPSVGLLCTEYPFYDSFEIEVEDVIEKHYGLFKKNQ